MTNLNPVPYYSLHHTQQLVAQVSVTDNQITHKYMSEQ